MDPKYFSTILHRRRIEVADDGKARVVWGVVLAKKFTDVVEAGSIDVGMTAEAQNTRKLQSEIRQQMFCA